MGSGFTSSKAQPKKASSPHAIGNLTEGYWTSVGTDSIHKLKLLKNMDKMG